MDYKEGLSTTEELVGLSNNNVNDATHIAKGKRTKRLRLLSNMTSSCSSASGGTGGGDDQGSFSISSTTTTTDQEEEDMANCLILLAQGGRDSHHHHHHHHQQQQQQQQENQKQQADEDHDAHGDGNNKAEIKSRKFSEMGATNNNNNKVGFYIYECKTCNRTFPSFQALGGHRASHKKPKLAMAVEEKKTPPPAQPAPAAPPSPPPPSSQPQVMMNTNYDHHHRLEFETGERKPHIKSVPPNPISLQLGSAQKANFNGNNKAKIHECSICGSEFTSGQALGGHMRRHRASTNASTCNATAAAGTAAVAVEVQPRNILELDLNLPAPEEDLREPKFQFSAATQKSMVLSAAPALVDCHY